MIDIQVIQSKIQIGSKVVLRLTNGHEISGILSEIAIDHITIRTDKGYSINSLESISSLDVILNDTPSLPDKLKNQEEQVISSPNDQEKEGDDFSKEVLKKLYKIESNFRVNLQTAKIDLKLPNFEFPNSEIIEQKKANIEKKWDLIKNKYEYARKIQELDPKFHRIQSMVIEMCKLAKECPKSTSIKRHLAYLYYLMNEQQAALKLYKDLSLKYNLADDWYNLAVVALKNGDGMLACYGLEQFFCSSPFTEASVGWYIWVGLQIKISDYTGLNRLSSVTGRILTIQEEMLLLRTIVYLLYINKYEQLANDLVKTLLENRTINLQETLKQLNEFKNDEYQQFILNIIVEIEKIKKDENKKEIVIKKEDQIINNEEMTSLDDIFKDAIEYARKKNYPNAIAQMKKLQKIEPNYPKAQEYLEKWQKYASESSIPKGSGPYVEAKKAQQIEKDLNKAQKLLRTAIDEGDNVESAVKDLAGILVQQGNPQDAINLLQKHHKNIKNKKSIDNMLINFYQSAGKYEESIKLLYLKYKQAYNNQQKAQIMEQIAGCYLRQEDYEKSEKSYREVLKYQYNNRFAQKNLAICLFKMKRYDEAKKILNRILDSYADIKAAELLDAINQADTTGESSLIESVIQETILSGSSRKFTGFTQFFLDRCDYRGVPSEHVQNNRFSRSDIQQLENLATQLGTKRPQDRASYYLSAAKIMLNLDEDDSEDDSNSFYKYLCRSFASSGDNSVIENKHPDVAREFYCEALNAYDKVGDFDKGSGKTLVEQDAVNSLVRFLFSTLGQSQIPIKPKIPSINETIENVLNSPQKDRVLDSFVYLISRSQYAAKRILSHLFENQLLHRIVYDYFHSLGILKSEFPEKFSDFSRLWNELLKKNIDVNRNISNEIRHISKFEFTQSFLEDSIKHINQISNDIFLSLDQQRVAELKKIIELALELCKQDTFEEQERLCSQIYNRCQDLMKEIEDSPTKISVEDIYSVIEIVKEKSNTWLNELYVNSTPQVSLKLPIESYVPNNNKVVELEITVANRKGCSPAESLELIIQEDESLFTLDPSETKLKSSLRGGDQETLIIPIHVTEQAIKLQTFSLSIYSKYRTRTEKTEETPPNSFSIRLYPEEEFEEILNPYSSYAEGGPVDNPEMFYGRGELIENITKAIEESQNQGRCIVIYGQKRSGKSSILYHLKRRLQKNKNMLIIDVGNIGSFIDEDSKYPFVYQILWIILSKLQDGIEDKISEGFYKIDISFPRDREFYEHPSPLLLFNDIINNYRRKISNIEDWQNVKLILFIDEFSYIYEQIISGHIPETFMKNWKAILQEHGFSAILAGQDVMSSFIQRFPNEFGTAQSERVSYLRQEDAIKLIDEPIRIGGRNGESRYRERAIERILDFTAGSPFYIQMICNRLVEYMNHKRAKLVTEADVEQLKNELIQGVNALGFDKFDNLISSGDNSEDAIPNDDIIKVLKLIAINSQMVPCNRNSIICDTKVEIDRILDDLVKRDVIERNKGTNYTIKVGLFKEWLIKHQ